MRAYRLGGGEGRKKIFNFRSPEQKLERNFSPNYKVHKLT